MKGVIFNVFNDIVVEQYDEQTWENLLDRAEVSGAYTSLGSYGDQDMFQLVAAASDMFDMTPEQCLCWLGREMLPRFRNVYPGMLERYSATLPTLKALNNVIHPEVVKLYPGAIVPVFHYHATTDQSLVIEYCSSRGICSLAHGLMLGCGDYFNETVHVEHTECRHRGDERCLFHVTVP